MYYLIALISCGFLIDIWTCVLTINRDRGGHGPSGFAVGSLLLFYWMPLLAADRWDMTFLTNHVFLDFIIFGAIHGIMVFGIPTLVDKLSTKPKNS
jgi:hypothetical protein